jgi:hypothetical protein
MNWTVLLYGVVAVAVLLVVGYLVERWGVFEDSRAVDGAEQVNRQQTASQSRPRIPLRDKPRQLPTELKLLSLILTIAGVVVAYYTFQFLQTGNTGQFAYTTQLQYGLVALIGTGAGVAYRGKKDAGVGKVHVIYETDDGTEVEGEETILFDRSAVTYQDDGVMLVRELRKERLLGLFRRYKLVGHDRELRADRPLGDIVTHELTRDAVELDDGVYEMRTQKQVPVDGTTASAADYKYKPPNKLPYEKQVKMQEQQRKMNIELRSVKAQLAHAHSELGDLERKLRNAEYNTREDVKSDLEELKELVAPSQEHVTVEANRGQARRHVNGQQDIQSAGDGGAEGEA